MALRNVDKLRAPLSKMSVKFRALIRRMIVTRSEKGLWALDGFDDEHEDGLEPFPGIGFYSRPAATGEPEALVVKVGGGSTHAVIVATRDEKVRQAIAAAKDLAVDETIVFNSTGALIHFKADGSVEVQPAAGQVVNVRRAGASIDQLVTKNDFINHMHATAPVGAVSPPSPLPPFLAFVYTQALKAE
jgi:phage gp45-like